MVQASLMFTRAHLNKWWTFTLEASVLFHGTVVAILQGADLWPMFFFGFAAMFIITQMYGLGLKPWLRWAFVGAFAIAAIVVYSSRGWVALNEIIRIPAIEYLVVFILALFIWGGLRLADRIHSRSLAPQS